MPDDLYERDVLAWSSLQAELLRRLGRGERVNGIDWNHVAEEIEGVGLAQLNSVRSYLRILLVHLLKIHRWPESQAIGRWREEVATCQADAAQRFAPSMRQKIDLDRLYTRAIKQLDDAAYDGQPPRAWPDTCPFTLDALLNASRADLEGVIAAAGDVRPSAPVR
jgi:hypothetical protein